MKFSPYDYAMIIIKNVFDRPKLGETRHDLALGVNLTIHPDRYVVLSRDPALRKPAIDLFGGLRPPQKGKIIFSGPTSWPIGRPAFMRGKVNGYHLIGLIARIYGLDLGMCISVVLEMMSRPDVLDGLIEHWPAMARLEFGHAVALLPQFDVYIVDGTLPFAKSRFTSLWRALFEERIYGKTLILSTLRANAIKEICNKAIILVEGRIEVIDDIEGAIAKYPPRPAPEGEERQRTDERSADNDFV